MVLGVGQLSNVTTLHHGDVLSMFHDKFVHVLESYVTCSRCVDNFLCNINLVIAQSASGIVHVELK